MQNIGDIETSIDVTPKARLVEIGMAPNDIENRLSFFTQHAAWAEAPGFEGAKLTLNTQAVSAMEKLTSFSYQTASGKHKPEFSFHQQPDGIIRVYIQKGFDYAAYGREAKPSVREVLPGCHYSHRRFDPIGDYICIGDHLQPLTLDEAKIMTALWSEYSEKYCLTGREF